MGLSAFIRPPFVISVALLGMVLGRAVSLFIERPGNWPLIFMLMEATLVGLLWWSR